MNQVWRRKLIKQAKTIEEKEIRINHNFPMVSNFFKGDYRKVKITILYIDISDYYKLQDEWDTEQKLKFINLYIDGVLKIIDYYELGMVNFSGTEIYAFSDHNSKKNVDDAKLLEAALDINSFLNNLPFEIKFKIVIASGQDLLSIIHLKKRKEYKVALINGTIYRAKEIFNRTDKTNIIYLNERYERVNSKWLKEIPHAPCVYPVKRTSTINNEIIYELDCIFTDWKWTKSKIDKKNKINSKRKK